MCNSSLCLQLLPLVIAYIRCEIKRLGFFFWFATWLIYSPNSDRHIKKPKLLKYAGILHFFVLQPVNIDFLSNVVFLFYLQTMFMVIPFVVNGVLTELSYSHPAVLILQTIYTSSWVPGKTGKYCAFQSWEWITWRSRAMLFTV